MDQFNVVTKPREPWNKGELVGQKTPLKLKEIWAIRIRLQLAKSGHSRSSRLIASQLNVPDKVR